MNEVRLIDANALKEELARHEPTIIFNRNYDGLLADIIDNAPTVEITEEQAIDKLHETGWLQEHDKQMTERPQGEWIENSLTIEKTLNCSICGAKSRQSVYGYYFHDNFCPNCGADMRKGGAE